jgi:hypothetical protein
VPEFKVWIDGYNGKDDPEVIKSYEARAAAEKYVEDHHSDLDYTTEIDVRTMNAEGVQEDWTVTVESIPSFSASPRKSSR